MNQIDLVIRYYTTPASIVADIGANMGGHSRTMAAIAKTVFAFEPNPIHADHLRREMPGNVTVCEAAASDVEGEATFYIDERPDKGAVASSLMQLNGLEGQTRPVTVKTMTLDRFFAKEKVVPSFIKVDVEGWEPNVVKGAMGIIRAHRPAIVLEFWETHFERYRPMFEELSKTHYLVRVGDGVDVLAYYSVNPPKTSSDVLCIPKPK